MLHGTSYAWRVTRRCAGGPACSSRASSAAPDSRSSEAARDSRLTDDFRDSDCCDDGGGATERAAQIRVLEGQTGGYYELDGP